MVLDVGAKVVGSLVDDLLKFALLPDKLLLGQLLDLCFDLSIIKFKINELVAGRTLARTLLHFLGLDFLQFVPKRAKRLLADIWLLGSGKAFKKEKRCQVFCDLRKDPTLSPGFAPTNAMSQLNSN